MAIWCAACFFFRCLPHLCESVPIGSMRRKGRFTPGFFDDNDKLVAQLLYCMPIRVAPNRLGPKPMIKGVEVLPPISRFFVAENLYLLSAMYRGYKPNCQFIRPYMGSYNPRKTH